MNVPQPSVDVDDLTKVYNTDHIAVSSVSLQAAGGQVVGVVGPNGAGKSTILRVLSTLLRPTSGQVRICGYDINDIGNVRPVIGVALQDVGLDPLMTGREHLAVQAALYRLPRSVARKRSDELIEQFGLGPVADKVVGMYSGGTARRLDLAIALLHEPLVVMFDEPTVGLDPRSRRDVWSLVRDMAAAGRVVLFSTQYLEEADHLCDRVYVVDQGTVVASGSPSSLKAQVGGATLRLRPESGVGSIVELMQRCRPAGRYEMQDDTVVVFLDDDDDGVAALANILAEASRAKMTMQAATIAKPTLDDVFFYFTGAALKPEPLSGKGFDLAASASRGIGRRPNS